MPNNPEVSVILINYNSRHYTINCVNSIIEHTKSKNYEIVIVDNNSKKEDFIELKKLESIPSVKIFGSRINLGFSGGNMLGVQQAHPNSAYYFFLNNDCVFVNDVISILGNFFDETPAASIATGQMYSQNMQLLPSFGYYPSVGAILLGTGFMRLFNKEMYRSNKKEYSEPITIPYATGSAMFVRRAHFVDIGGFDTNYFLYSEEEDLCMRMRKIGWRIYLVPGAKFIHYGGGSTNRNLAVEKEFYISYLYFLRKYYSAFNRVILRLLFAVKLLRKSYKGSKFLKLGLFVLRGAPMKESLRFRQNSSLDKRVT